MPSSGAQEPTSIRTDVLIAALVLAFTAVPIQVQPLDPQILREVFRNQPSLLDVVANVFGYIPLGLALAYRGPARALSYACSLSVFAELTQIFCVGRSPDIVDVATNTLGAAIGLSIARKWQVLPDRLVVSRTVSVLAMIAATTYVALGGGQTVEGFLDAFTITLKASPWRPTNPRGTSSAGALEAHWAFDKVDRGRVADDSGNGLRGTLVNGAALSSGVSGAALALNGSQWVDFGRPTSLRLVGSMTLSAWVNASAFPADDAAIVSSLDADELGYQLDLTVDQGTRTLGFKIADASKHLMARYGKTEVMPGRWYHVAGVYDASRRTLDVYLNGSRDNGCLLGTVTERQRPAGGHVFVGRRPELTGYGFIGSIDDVKIQSRPLTAREVQSEAAAIGGVDKPPKQLAEAALQQSLPDDAGVVDACASVALRDEGPPRIPGPLITLGMLIALACVGFLRGPRVRLVAPALCLVVGSTASLWLPASLAPAHALLPAVYLLLGALAVLLAMRRRE